MDRKRKHVLNQLLILAVSCLYSLFIYSTRVQRSLCYQHFLESLISLPENICSSRLGIPGFLNPLNTTFSQPRCLMRLMSDACRYRSKLGPNGFYKSIRRFAWKLYVVSIMLHVPTDFQVCAASDVQVFAMRWQKSALGNLSSSNEGLRTHPRCYIFQLLAATISLRSIQTTADSTVPFEYFVGNQHQT